MSQLTININNPENMSGDLNRYSEIITALIASGGLDGVKSGQTIIHFDSNGLFMGVELNYWPWRRKKRIL